MSGVLPSTDVQLGVMAERLSGLCDTVEKKFEDFGRTMRDIQSKQQARDMQCASEREKNVEASRQLSELWKKVDNADECRTCKQVERMTRLETQLQILVKVAWFLSTSTIGMLLKVLYDYMTHQVLR